MPSNDKIWGYVTRVVDGDTVEFRVASRSRWNRYPYRRAERVRLVRGDAPELGSRGARAAASALLRATRGKRFGLDIRCRDKYGRVLGRLVPA